MTYYIDSDLTVNERGECELEEGCTEIKNIGRRNLRLTFNHFTETYVRPGETAQVPERGESILPMRHLTFAVVDRIVPPFNTNEPRPDWGGEHGKQP